MESSLPGLTLLFQEKLKLYRELIDVLQVESGAIIASQVDQLWEISRKKSQIVSDIEALRGRILELLKSSGVDHAMSVSNFQTAKVMDLVPMENRKALLHFTTFFLLAKEEIRSRTRENMVYAEKYLSTINELLSIFMGNDNPYMFYDRSRMADNAGTHSRLHQEA